MNTMVLPHRNASLKEALRAHYNFKITPAHINQIVALCTSFELRGTHPEALNTALLGVHKAFFTTRDQTALFDIFGVDYDEFKRYVHSVASVDPKHKKIVSDPFNLLTVWVTHLGIMAEKTIKSKKALRLLTTTLFKYMQYKFFTSVVNHSLRYVNPDIMTKTIDDLSAKFEIKSNDTPTWKAVIAKRSEDVMDSRSIHAKTLRTFSPDVKVFYVLSDVQTRLRTRLVLISNLYYEHHANNDKMEKYGIVGDIDGEKVINNVVSSMDSIITKTANAVLNLNDLIDHTMIKAICARTKNITPEMMRTILMGFSDMAISQNRSNSSMETVQSSKSLVHYKGYRALVGIIVQKVYRICIKKKVNMGSRLHILEEARNAFRSSQLDDPDIKSIKHSVKLLLDELTSYTKDSTLASLRICLILYIVLVSLRYSS